MHRRSGFWQGHLPSKVRISDSSTFQQIVPGGWREMGPAHTHGAATALESCWST